MFQDARSGYDTVSGYMWDALEYYKVAFRIRHRKSGAVVELRLEPELPAEEARQVVHFASIMHASRRLRQLGIGIGIWSCTCQTCGDDHQSVA